MKCALGIHSLIADISLVRGEAHSLRCSLRRAIGPTYAVEVLPSFFFFFFRSSRLLTALTCAQYATANAAAAVRRAVRRGGVSSLLTCSMAGQQQLKAAALPNQQLEATTMLCSCRHCAPSCSSRTLFCSRQRRRRAAAATPLYLFPKRQRALPLASTVKEAKVARRRRRAALALVVPSSYLLWLRNVTMVAQSDLDDSGWFYVSNLIKGFPGCHPIQKGRKWAIRLTTSLSYFYDFELRAQSGSSSTENEKKKESPLPDQAPDSLLACSLLTAWFEAEG